MLSPSRKYDSLLDPGNSSNHSGPPIDGEPVSIGEPVCVKFCNMGMVTSKKWVSAYLTIVDSVARVYDSVESCREQPHDPLISISLTSNHKHSEVKVADNSQDRMKIVNFYCFYIQVENGIFAPTKLIKIAALSERSCDKILRAIRASTRL